MATESEVAREKQLNIGFVFCVFGGGIFLVRGNRVRSGASGDIERRVCLFCFRMEPLATESEVAREAQLNSPADLRQGRLEAKNAPNRLFFT